MLQSYLAKAILTVGMLISPVTQAENLDGLYWGMTRSEVQYAKPDFQIFDTPVSNDPEFGTPHFTITEGCDYTVFLRFGHEGLKTIVYVLNSNTFACVTQTEKTYVSKMGKPTLISRGLKGNWLETTFLFKDKISCIVMTFSVNITTNEIIFVTVLSSASSIRSSS